MSEHNDGGPAFPSPPLRYQVGDDGTEIRLLGFHGMSLRDWYAGQALVGLLACPESEGTIKTMADYAYEYADAMMKRRKK